MRVGIVILPEHRWWAAEPLWRMAEEYGFDHAWTYDHLGWRSLVDRTWFDAVPTLTAAATVTSRIKLGTLVASPNFRHPVHFARELTALDDISDGRFLLGVGAGSAGFDATVLGQEALPDSRRVDRFGEFVELLDTILKQDSTTYDGEYYSAAEARRAPGCVQTPRMPFIVAANGPRSMRLAARFGQGWVTNGSPESRAGEDTEQWWRSVREASERYSEALTAEGRTPARSPRYLSADAAPRYSLSSVEHFRDVLGRAGELGFTDVITHWPRPEQPYAGQESIIEEIAAEVLPGLKEV
ncbi:LLM class flavin-dependent oxidoreductase [Haloactinomyces albus]|uniref:Alkanesulfonate monooxygenase SsuD/methylene tetrahydromethanopterin reductase-like flavin-dependent oxidoreductase (Luciferase family) n=1 Tax=Haloactinomyces albus TaxID=1352928 RepID=A0AAE3ZBJ2_9ACTN|nr:LLM class flavin-dependent oxidoreductase [Haloactinomyces albus]MDR7301881.1 alkanesulfonate monooxygenase SsuD/methylene tetrahydromethanopterin reductase-like flavin-dependent oxidoreductase (luciferase family) [Haloactinomyces albus]